MKKVLIIITTGFESNGGLASVMMNYYRHMDRTNYQIDFASTNIPDERLAVEVEESGARYFNLGERKSNTLKYICNLIRLLRKERYDIIHVNGNSATMIFELLPALLCGVKLRIAHGHTTKSNYPKMHNILAPFFRKTYNKAIAVSKDTGEWLYHKNYIILNNAIDVGHYQYNVSARKKIRKELGLSDQLVIGNVGKLNGPKNHTFLIDIFMEINKKREDAVLIIAGGGELEAELKQKCKDLQITDKVYFLGMLDDVSEVIQAYDVFVFTSIFEGLGMALIEAQACGLECISSDVVPEETAVTENIQYMSLNQSAKEWADKVLEVSNYDRMEHSKKAVESVKKHGYDIRYEASKLVDLYNS